MDKKIATDFKIKQVLEVTGQNCTVHDWALWQNSRQVVSVTFSQDWFHNKGEDPAIVIKYIPE